MAWYVVRMPDPATADGRGLLRWMVTRDLSLEPVSTRKVLVARLEGELHRGIAWHEVDAQLDTERRQLLGSNIELLAEQWFRDTVDAFYEQPVSQRPAYVDLQIDRLFSNNSADRASGDVALIDQLQAAMSVGNASPPTSAPSEQRGLTWLLAKVKRWASRAGGAEQHRTEEFILAVQTRWLLRQLPSL